MTDNLKRFPEMPSCCCYGLIDGKILRWCGTQRVRFLLWQKQLRAIVRRTMSSLCRRKRLGELCPQAAKLWIFIAKSLPLFDTYIMIIMSLTYPESSRPMHRKCWNWHAWSSCSPCSWRCRLFHLKGGSPSSGTRSSSHRSAAGERSTCHGGGTPMQGSIFSSKIWKMMDLLMISNLIQICFFVSYVFSFVYMVVWCWYQFTQLLSDVTLGPFRRCFVQAMKERALAAESYLSSLEQELQLHKEIVPQLQVASSS